MPARDKVRHYERKAGPKGKCGYGGRLIFLVDDFPKEPGDKDGLGGTGCVCPLTKEKAVLEVCRECGKADELLEIHFEDA